MPDPTNSRLGSHAKLFLGMVAAVAAIIVIVLALRSGGRDADPLGDSSQRLVTSCMESRAADRPVCQCIADELVTSQGLATADALDAARAAIEDGKRPAKVAAAATACRGKT